MLSPFFEPSLLDEGKKARDYRGCQTRPPPCGPCLVCVVIAVEWHVASCRPPNGYDIGIHPSDYVGAPV